MKELQREVSSQIGRFLTWGQAVSIDQARRVLRFLPESREELLVEFECEASPDTEQLDARLVSY
jgi:hypothetical protein